MGPLSSGRLSLAMLPGYDLGLYGHGRRTVPGYLYDE